MGQGKVQQSFAILRRVALGHSPGGLRIVYQRTFPRDQSAIVRGIVVTDGIGREGFNELLAVFHHAPYVVGFDGDLTLDIHKLCPKPIPNG